MATISDLSCDLVEEILSRVPITCLGAVRSTCKRWNTLSKSRLLCKAQVKQQFLGFITNSKLCSLRFRFDLYEEEFAVKEISDSFEISKVLVCDGLLLCVTVTRDDEDKIIQQRLMVWNPYLGQTRLIQLARTAYDESDVYALGYDTNRCNHKILRYSKEECEIYDFKSDSWRTIDLDVTENWACGLGWRCRGDFSASLKGNTYFVDYDILDETYTNYFICFDFTREIFGEYLRLPWSHQDSYFKLTPISSFGEEKLAAFKMNIPIFGVEIWVTTKIEPNEVLWRNFLKIDLEAIPRFTASSFFIYEDMKRAVLLSDECDDSLKAYIIGEKDFFKAVDLGAVNPHDDFGPLVCSNSYVPSLVQIKQN